MSQPINENVTELINERVKVYGDPKVTFPQIAQAWSAVLGFEVLPYQVPLCLIAMKLVRTSQTPDYSDNSDDVEGYLDIFRKVVGEDMIHARTVDEYVLQKHARRQQSSPTPGLEGHVFVEDGNRYSCTGCSWALLGEDVVGPDQAEETFIRVHSARCQFDGGVAGRSCYMVTGCGCQVQP